MGKVSNHVQVSLSFPKGAILLLWSRRIPVSSVKRELQKVWGIFLRYTVTKGEVCQQWDNEIQGERQGPDRKALYHIVLFSVNYLAALGDPMWIFVSFLQRVVCAL